MLSNKLTFSLGLGCLVALLIAATVILVPSVVHADSPMFKVINVASIPTDDELRDGAKITITVEVDAGSGDGPVKYTHDPDNLVTLKVGFGGTQTKDFALKLTSSNQPPNFPASTATTVLKANVEFEYTVVNGDGDVVGITLGGTGDDGETSAINNFGQFSDSRISGGNSQAANGNALLPTDATEKQALTDKLAAISIYAHDLGVPIETTLDLPSKSVDHKGFVILAREGATPVQIGLTVRPVFVSRLPDLDALFNGNGGTLELVDAKATAETPAKVGPIITEIMWGEDAGDHNSQWIEIYNASTESIDLANYKLAVTPFSPDPFTSTRHAVDTVSNLGDGRWQVWGQSGRTKAATDLGISGAATNLISMYRKIDYDKAKVEANALKDVKDGTLKDSWAASTTPALNLGVYRVGTPGEEHTTQVTQADKTSIPYSPVIINEIGNNSGDENDWIELRNVSTDEVNLKKWELSVIVPDGDDTGSDPDIKVLVAFPDKDYKLAAGKILLIVNKDPLNTPLARGKKFGDADGMTAAINQENRGVKEDALFYDAKGSLNELPESGKFLLVLRTESKTNDEKIVDITGTLFEEDTGLATHIWPLKATAEGHGDIVEGDGNPEEFKSPFVYQRKKADSGFGEHAWGVASYTGIGYDRTADNIGANGGTPGFPNNSLKEKPADLAASDLISISEIMVNSNNGRQPQWIELRNGSHTQGVNLDAWRLRIENVGEVDARKSVTIDLPNGYRLAPNQTILIATRRGSASRNLQAAENRVIILWLDSDAKKALEVESSRYTMLSTEGFTLKLFGKDQQLTDTPVDAVTIGADLLTADKIGDARQRISLVRFYNGRIPGNWGSAKGKEQLDKAPSENYYGSSDDIGTPGWYPGGALPVSLSSFYPALDKATGAVLIKWTTESELNNAGFNILRSENRNGEFKVINPTMIPGAGTTGEKHHYSYTDKTAKPNVVYYYQIEDVSFAGERQTLQTTHLRGNVSAGGKLTTTWGGLKAQE